MTPAITIDQPRPSGDWLLGTTPDLKNFYIYDKKRNQFVMSLDETTGILTVYVGAVMPDTDSKTPAIIKRVVVKKVGDSK